MLIIFICFCKLFTNFVVFFTLLSYLFAVYCLCIIMLSNNVVGGVYMQLFEENKQRMCCCNEAVKKGIYTKSLENNNFSIYGNLMHGRSILLNYHGKLIKNNDITNDEKSKAPNIYLYYCLY